jgi:hypothetical protein
MITVNIRTNIAALQAAISADKRMMERATKQAMRKARPATDAVLNSEMGKAFKVKDARAVRSWRLAVSKDRAAMILTNLMRGFSMHVTGGTIRPRHGRALLIPINTAGGTRIGTKKFYNMIEWLQLRKLTVILGDKLYVKPVMNESRRGGVGVGTRVNKRFRSLFSGSYKRPSGFDIKLNAYGLTPIAIIRSSIRLRARFNMDRIVRDRIIPVIINQIGSEVDAFRRSA